MAAASTLVLRRLGPQAFACDVSPPEWLGQIAELRGDQIVFEKDAIEDPLVDFLESAQGAWTGTGEPLRSEPITYGDRASELVIEAIACSVGDLDLLVITPWCENRKSGLRSAREGALRAENLDLLQLQWKAKEASLQESNEALERFARAASHDLRQPLRTMRSFADLLSEDHQEQLDGRATKFLSFISESAGDLSRLIDRLLDFAHVREASIVSEPVDPAAVVDRVWAGLGDLAQQSGAVLYVGSLPTVSVDETLLGIVFQNLIENAMKFSREGCLPEIEVQGSMVGTVAHFRVEDNGVGIPVAQRARLFEPFERLSQSRLREGNGLGLALAKESVERWGGELSVSDSPAGGATFEFTVPALDAQLGRSESVRLAG